MDYRSPQKRSLHLPTAHLPTAHLPTTHARTTWKTESMAQKLTGTITNIDAHGNLVSDITAEALTLAKTPRDASVRITCDEHLTLGIYDSYADHPPMTLIAVLNGSAPAEPATLKLSIVADSAKIMLGVSPGTPIVVQW